MDNQIILYAEQNLEALIINNAPFSVEEETKFNGVEALSWENFPKASIICNFNNSLTSSNLEQIQNEIVGYEILKQKNDENFYKLVANIDLGELQSSSEGSDFYFIEDYNISNNTQYTYYISALSENTIEVTSKNKIVTDWDVYTLSPIISYGNNIYEIIKDETGKPIIWTFGLNFQEGEITLNQDKTVFTTFAPMPKISVGDLNYTTGSFSCLLGSILCNGEYYESNIILTKWEDMLKNNSLFLFKNPKGEVRVISIDANPTRSYMNEAANYNINYNTATQEITTRPTTISFTYTEVLESKDIRIFSIGD